MAYTTINKAKDHFNSLTYTGNGASPRSITGVGFRPDLVWTKDRSDSSTQPWHDVVRGATYAIRSDSNVASENTPAYGYINSFDSDGYTFQQGSSDIAGATVGHGLGVVPKVIIVKAMNTTDNWEVYHSSLGAEKYLELNRQDAQADSTQIWNDTEPTSSVFSIGDNSGVNTNGNPYIAYCFAEKTGYSKFGSYKGNANADGPFIYTGFRPSFVIIKRYNSTKDWFVWDAATSPRNPTNAYGRPNASTAWGSYDWLDLVSNGIKIRNTSDGASGNGDQYVYWAFGQSLVGTNNVVANAR